MREAVRRLAERKAREVAARQRSGTILAADTVVEFDGEILGKPRDAAHASAMLERLSGRVHRVHTGVAVLSVASLRLLTGVATSEVAFREIDPREIEAYVRSGEPFGKAGAYAVQGSAERFVARLTGELDNVIGLPGKLVADLLTELARVEGLEPA